MKNLKDQAKHVIRNAYFWQRLTVLAVLSFTFAMFIRIAPIGVTLIVFFAAILSGIWLVAAMFRRQDSTVLGTKPMKRWWVRLIALATLAPVLTLSGMVFGVTAGEIIKPYSAAELAENKARAEAEALREEQRKAAEEARKEEQAKIDADRVAAEKAAAEEQAKRDAAEKAAAEEQAKRDAAEKAAAEEQAAAEASNDQAVEQVETVDWARINKLKDSAPLLYATEYCGQTLLLLGVSVYDYVAPSEDGTALFLTTQSGYSVDGNMVYACISDKLQFSPALKANINTTTALAGTKSWTENRMDLQWTYHPDNGLNMSIVREKECFLIFCN
jgi:hypothetical protein